MTTTILLPRGHEMLVDASDAELVEAYLWHAIPGRDTYYAQAGNHPNLYAHRLITEAPSGLMVDHRNGNGLDNRRSNLRLCTNAQNLANRPAPKNNTTGYKGVSRLSRSGRFEAYLTVAGHRRFLGSYRDPWDAAQAYNAAALEAWGAFAYLNVYRPQAGHDGGPGCPGTVTG